MKKITLILAAVLALFAVSCQQDNAPARIFTQEEQITYLDNVGEEFLAQIEPKDFQKIADIIKDIQSTKIVMDPESEEKINKIIGGLYVQEGPVTYMLINAEKVNGTITIRNGVAKYEEGTGKKVVFISTTNNYTATINVKSSDKKVLLDRNETKLTPQDEDIILLVPESLNIDVNYNNDLYARVEVKLDAANMPENWMYLSVMDLNLVASAKVHLNGDKSYLLDITHADFKECQGNILADLYGKSGNKILSVDGTGLDVSDGLVVKDKIYVDILGKAAARLTGMEKIDIFLEGTGVVQSTINPNEATISFTNGKTEDLENVFTTKNFPKTIASALQIAMDFQKIFNF